jgi:Family of unknown function (DUF5305)
MKLPGRFFERDENLVVAMGLIGGIAIALTALAVYAYILPKTETETETLAKYEHTGRYTYTVDTEPSALNPKETIGPILPGSIEDGKEPPPAIFTRLAKALHFLYAYQLQGASEVSGTVSAELEIKAGTSWSQRVPLADVVPFDGATGGIEGTIDFTQIAALLTQIEEQTGVTTGSVELTVIPEVDVSATANRQQFSETYSSPLTFTYTSNLITPGETLAFSEPGTITSTTERHNELQFLGGSVEVATVRDTATPLAVASLALAGVFAAIYFLGVGRSETAMVRTRYGSLLVPIAEVESAASHRISVASLIDLAQLAKREGRSLFVRDFDNGAQAYLMHDGMVIYQFAVGDVPQGWIRSSGVASYEQRRVSTREEAPVSALEMPVYTPEASPPEWLNEEEAPPAPVTEIVTGESEEARLVESIPEWLMAPYEHGEPEDAAEEATQHSNGSGLALEAQAVPAGTGQPDAEADHPEASLSGHDEGNEAPESVAAAEDPQAAEVTSEELSDGFADLVWTRSSESETAAASAEEIVEAELASADAETTGEVVTELPEAEVQSTADDESEQRMADAESVEESNPATAESVRSPTPRLSVQRWLRNRSGGPLLDEHTREPVNEVSLDATAEPALSEESSAPAAESDFGANVDVSDVSIDEPASLPEVLQVEDASEPVIVSDTSEPAGSEVPLHEATYETSQDDSEATSSALESVEDGSHGAMRPETEAVVIVSEAYSQLGEDLEVTNDESGEQEAVDAANLQMSVEDLSSAEKEAFVAAIKPDAVASPPEAEELEAKTFGPDEHEAVTASSEADAQLIKELGVKTLGPGEQETVAADAVMTPDEDVSPTEEDESVDAFEPVAVKEDGARLAQLSRTRRRRQPLEKKLTRYAKKWLSDFLDYQLEERSGK